MNSNNGVPLATYGYMYKDSFSTIEEFQKSDLYIHPEPGNVITVGDDIYICIGDKYEISDIATSAVVANPSGFDCLAYDRSYTTTTYKEIKITKCPCCNGNLKINSYKVIGDDYFVKCEFCDQDVKIT